MPKKTRKNERKKRQVQYRYDKQQPRGGFTHAQEKTLVVLCSFHSPAPTSSVDCIRLQGMCLYRGGEHRRLPMESDFDVPSPSCDGLLEANPCRKCTEPCVEQMGYGHTPRKFRSLCTALFSFFSFLIVLVVFLSRQLEKVCLVVAYS